MKKVFLSYAREDTKAVQDLRAFLGDFEVYGWMDQSDIATGEAVAQKIRESLKQSSAIIVIVSERSLKSQWVQFEIGAAVGMGKPLIPIIIGGQDIHQALPIWLQDIQYLDARRRPVKEVALEIKRLLSNVVSEKDSD
jgi:hypothetical protein